MSNRIVFICSILLLMPFFVFATEENCYGNHALNAKKFGDYEMVNGFCVYPEEVDYPVKNEEDKKYPFLGFGAYEWNTFGLEKNKNVSIINDLNNCGVNNPCYCDSSLKPDNLNFQTYCCPSYSACQRDAKKIYENRPFLTVYRKNGDLDIKGNLVISGDSNYFFGKNVFVGFFSKLSGLYIELKEKFHDVILKGGIIIADNLVFNSKYSSLELNNNTQISKVKKNKIIQSALNGKMQNNTWHEIDAGNLVNYDFENLSGITTDTDYYYLVDNGNKKIIKIADTASSSSVLSVGNDDWAWKPVGITNDDSGKLFVTSSYDTYDEIDNSFFRVTSPPANTVFKVGEIVVISWSKIPKAKNYEMYYTLNGGELTKVKVEDDESSFEIEASDNMVGTYTLLLGAEVDGKKVFTNNTLVFNVVSDTGEVFRLTSPGYASSSPKLVADYPNYVSDYAIGDTIFFSWDDYTGALEYRLVYSVNFGVENEISVGNNFTTELKASVNELNVGDYKFKVRAYKNGLMLKESMNEVVFSIYQKEKKIKPLSDNLFSLKIEEDINGEAEINSWSQLIPDQLDFEQTKNYQILKEYFEFSNSDPKALYLKNPTAIKYHNGYLYVVDSGNNRIVRISESITTPALLAESLKVVKSTIGLGWQNNVNAILKKQLNDYWQVVYGKGSVKKDNVYNIENQYTPLGALNNPQGIFIDSNGLLFISDTDNKRVILQSTNKPLLPTEENWYKIKDWYKIEAPAWKPLGIIKQGKYLYITDIKNGSIVRVNIANQNLLNDEHSFFYNGKGLIFNDTYFVFGRRGQEYHQFSFPIDLIYRNNLFYIIDGVSDFGYSLIAGDVKNTSSSSLINLYSGESSRRVEDYTKNPYINEFNANALIDKIKVKDLVSLFNNQEDELRLWKKGPGISHCQDTCSDGSAVFSNSWCNGGSGSWSIDCLSCGDPNRTCYGQWDWEVNAPTCTYRVISPGAHQVTDCCAGMCTYSSCSTSCDDDGACSTTCVDYQACCSSSHTEYAPSCSVITENCHVGNAVSFENYTTHPDSNSSPILEDRVKSDENLQYSLKRGWPDYIYQ